MLTYCRHCKKLSRVTHYDRDNPVLSCGHIKSSPCNDKCAQAVNSALTDASIKTGRSVEQLQLGLFFDLLGVPVSYCPICNAIITILKNKRGERICGGNLFDNPGCGCLLKPISERQAC